MEMGKQFKNLFGFNPPIDMILTAAKGPTNAVIDVLDLDDEFKKRNPEYDPDKCTYKGKPDYSMLMFVKERYGEKADEFIRNNM